jgi:hypothetical protein
LGIEPGSKPKPDHREQKRKRLLEKFRTWEKVKADEYATLIRTTNYVLGHKYESMEQVEKYADLVNILSWFEYVLETILSGSDREKLELYRLGV